MCSMPPRQSQSLAGNDSCITLTDDGGFLGADAISRAAETASLAESWDNAWFINKGCQWLIQTMHEATGSPWYYPTAQNRLPIANLLRILWKQESVICEACESTAQMD